MQNVGLDIELGLNSHLWLTGMLSHNNLKYMHITILENSFCPIPKEVKHSLCGQFCVPQPQETMRVYLYEYIVPECS